MTLRPDRHARLGGAVRKRLRRYFRACRLRRYAWGWASMHDVAQREGFFWLRDMHS